jgi:hypothetical protein
MTRGLVAATLGHVTVLSLTKVTGILRGPQYPIYSRPGNDLTYRFPLIVETMARLRSL